jgi:tripartite-type tricarboxylate transporter receptor subunit TctC
VQGFFLRPVSPPPPFHHRGDRRASGHTRGENAARSQRVLAASPPDGYTLLAHSSAIVVSPLTVANAHYDPVKDFVAVAPLANLPNVLVVTRSLNVRTVQEFVATANARRITYGSAGVGTPVYLAMEKFRLAAGFQGDFIPSAGHPKW